MKYLLYTNDQLTGVYSNLGDAVSEEENIEIRKSLSGVQMSSKLVDT